MATQRSTGSRIHADGPAADTPAEAHTRDLLKRLASEGTDLVRSEIALAKLEMRDTARDIVLDSARLAAAIGIALAGVLALAAAGVIGLGHVLDGRFGLAALILGVLLVSVGGMLARTGIAGLKDPHKPEETVRSLKRDGEWAAAEMRQLKDELRS